MEKSKNIIASLVVLFLPLVSVADTIPENFPHGLLYQGKPINAWCMQSFSQSQSPSSIPLTQCSESKTGLTITGKNERNMQGYVGYDYQKTINGQKAYGYIYYKPIVEINGAYIISIRSNSDSMIEFSGINFVERKNDILYIKSLVPVGMRGLSVTTLVDINHNQINVTPCAGAILDIEVKDNKLTYKAAITPNDFVNLVYPNPYNQPFYYALASCASCCEAKASYEINLKQAELKPRLISVDLGSKAITLSEMDTAKYQPCFDQLINAYRKQGKVFFTPEQLNEFVTTLKTTCLKNETVPQKFW